MWNMRAVVVPLVIGTWGQFHCVWQRISINILNIFYRALIPKLEKSILLGSCHILRKFLTEHL